MREVEEFSHFLLSYREPTMGAAALRHKLDAGRLDSCGSTAWPSGATASNMPGGEATMGVLVSVGDYTADRGGSFYWKRSDLHPSTTPSTLRVKLDWAKAPPPRSSRARAPRRGVPPVQPGARRGRRRASESPAPSPAPSHGSSGWADAAQLGRARAISRQGRGRRRRLRRDHQPPARRVRAGHLAAATRPPKTDRMERGRRGRCRRPSGPAPTSASCGARPPLQPGIWAAKKSRRQELGRRPPPRRPRPPAALLPPPPRTNRRAATAAAASAAAATRRGGGGAARGGGRQAAAAARPPARRRRRLAPSTSTASCAPSRS